MDSLTFFRNWYDLAKLQTDDQLRLAFYDAVFAYAFDGEVPPDPGCSGKKTARAARFAYLTVAPVITVAAKKRAAGIASGSSRRKTNTATNTDEQTDEHRDEHETTSFRKEKKRIEENRIEKKVVGDTPSPAITVKDIENYFKRLENNANQRVEESVRREFIEWAGRAEFRTGNGPILKRSIGRTFNAWLEVHDRELRRQLQQAEIDGSSRNLDPGSTGFTRISEDDL